MTRQQRSHPAGHGHTRPHDGCGRDPAGDEARRHRREHRRRCGRSEGCGRRVLPALAGAQDDHGVELRGATHFHPPARDLDVVFEPLLLLGQLLRGPQQRRRVAEGIRLHLDVVPVAYPFGMKVHAGPRDLGGRREAGAQLRVLAGDNAANRFVIDLRGLGAKKPRSEGEDGRERRGGHPVRHVRTPSGDRTREPRARAAMGGRKSRRQGRPRTLASEASFDPRPVDVTRRTARCQSARLVSWVAG